MRDGARFAEEKTPTRGDTLSAAEVVDGFEVARDEARACPDAVAGMTIEIRADIDAGGEVVHAQAIGADADGPVARCVAAAVKTHARFAAKTRPLDSKTFAYTF